jgi:predicted dehydrogenase
VAACRKPVFVDKPFAVTSAEAREIMGLADQYRIPCMSASVRRYAETLQDVHKRQGEAPVTGAECFGPIEFVPTQPGWYWYGIHTVEVLYALLGQGCVSVTAVSGDGHELIVGKWRDGRVGLARGNAHPNVSHGALIHRANGTTFIDTASDGLQKYGRLMEAVLAMIRTGKPAVEPEETLEIIRFIEAANESRETGNTVYL